MPVIAKNHVKQRAEDRFRILQLLLNNKSLSEGILGKLEDPEQLHNPELLDQTAEIKSLVNKLPAPDLADTLEALPADERHALWRLVGKEKRGKTLVEASESVWDSLIDEMSDKELLTALRSLDIDEQVYL